MPLTRKTADTLYGTSTVLTARVPITSAEILNLNTSAKQLVPTPGPGFFIDVLDIQAAMTYNTTPYDTNTVLVAMTASGNPSSDYLTADSSFLTSTVSIIKEMPVIGGIYKENEAIVLSVQTGNPLNGNSDIVVYVTYRIVTI